MSIAKSDEIDAFLEEVDCATEVMYNMPSVYEVFPTEQYYNIAGQSNDCESIYRR